MNSVSRPEALCSALTPRAHVEPFWLQKPYRPCKRFSESAAIEGGIKSISTSRFRVSVVLGGYAWFVLVSKTQVVFSLDG